MTPRPTPFALVFEGLAEERFPAIRAGLAEAGHDETDRDAFVLAREVAELLRELGPEDTLGPAVEELVALVHAGYLYWRDGECLVSIDRATLERRLREPVPDSPVPGGRTYYLQLPAQRVWGDAVAGSPPEPLDGVFVTPRPPRVAGVAVFGLQPGRPGFTVAHGAGPRPAGLARLDRSALFSPTLPGGAEAGLFHLQGGEELLELVFRCHGLLPATGAVPGPQRVSLT